VVDLGAEHGHAAGLFARFFEAHVKDNSADAIVGLMQAAGFADPSTVTTQRRLFGPIFYARASVPA
jgi:hypothetical protein